MIHDAIKDSTPRLSVAQHAILTHIYPTTDPCNKKHIVVGIGTRFPPCAAQIRLRFPEGGFAGNQASISSPVSWKLGANFQKNGGVLWCAKQLFYYKFNFVNAGTKRNKIACHSLLLPCSLITGWNRGCFWFLYAGRMVNKKRCEKLLQWTQFLMWVW